CLEAGAARVVLTDDRGGEHAPRFEGAVVETRGPVRTTLRLDGSIGGPAACRVTCRLCFFGGTGLVRARLTVHNPRRARHRGGLWDLGDPGSVLFRDLSLELLWPGAESPCLTWSSEVGRPTRTCGAADFELYQDSSGGENWQS